MKNTRCLQYVLISLFLNISLLRGQTVQADSLNWNGPAELSVRLSASVEPGHVPMNRSVTLTVQVSWEGDINRIDIDEIEEPILSHLEITGTASANHVLGGDRPRSVREIVYTLKPTTLGMAYIESVILHYTDAMTDESHILRTERIGVEVLPPVREKAAGSFPWWIPAAAVVLAGGALYVLIRRRGSNRKEAQVPEKPIETSYLETLKRDVPLKEGDRKTAYAALSKLCRRYLAERYRIPALEATTPSLIEALQQTALDEASVLRLQKMFEEADVIKFSGQEATQAALENAYTALESLLEKNLAESRKTTEV